MKIISTRDATVRIDKWIVELSVGQGISEALRFLNLMTCLPHPVTKMQYTLYSVRYTV